MFYKNWSITAYLHVKPSTQRYLHATLVVACDCDVRSWSTLKRNIYFEMLTSDNQDVLVARVAAYLGLHCKNQAEWKRVFQDRTVFQDGRVF